MNSKELLPWPHRDGWYSFCLRPGRHRMPPAMTPTAEPICRYRTTRHTALGQAELISFMHKRWQPHVDEPKHGAEGGKGELRGERSETSVTFGTRGRGFSEERFDGSRISKASRSIRRHRSCQEPPWFVLHVASPRVAQTSHRTYPPTARPKNCARPNAEKARDRAVSG